MMYASKIEIKREPQPVRDFEEVELPDGWLTLELLAHHVKPGQHFSIFDRETGMFGTTPFLRKEVSRLETADEMAARIVKQEKYMENYEKHWAKYGPKK